jgi:hypothetical protein
MTTKYITGTYIAAGYNIAAGVTKLVISPTGGATALSPHTFVSAMAGLDAPSRAAVASHAMTAPREIAAALLTPRAATA